MVFDKKVKFITVKIFQPACPVKALSGKPFSEIGSHAHIHIPFGTMKQVKAFSYQE
jgi:hypothetical protein